ncbi:alpha/beta fold hydrolase [Trujillonella humicola]|uniref:alpha/beta fold hydrolase n=1 Tax=Trujillonella humicola TaxID=3383699 RepID=UPI0039069F0B
MTGRVDLRAEVLVTTTSVDGTRIGAWRSGSGPPLLLVHGGTADHTRWRPVLPLLEPYATVYAVDRRGRGASGDAPEYAVELEFADVAAVVDAIGGTVDVVAHSYGALCALGAALRTDGMRRLVLYEPPVLPPPRSTADDRMAELLAAGRRADLVETFFREIVGADDHQLRLIRAAPSWPARVAAAHTVVRERLIDPPYRFDAARYQGLDVPTLLIAGGNSAPFLQASTKAVAAAVPGARVTVLPGEQHVAIDSAPERFTNAVLTFLREDGVR